MKNIINILEKSTGKILMVLIIIIFLKTCSTNNKIEKVNKDLSEKLRMYDSLNRAQTVTKLDFQKMLTIEGLKSEKRMIQSTDRKILDVTRQTEIDKELEKLGSN